MATSQELITRAQGVRDETQTGKNTAQRVGSLFNDIILFFVGAIAGKQDKQDSALETASKEVVPAINEVHGDIGNVSDALGELEKDLTKDISLKQNITDNALQTTNKTIAGAINEVKSKFPAGSGHVISEDGFLILENPESFIKYFSGEWGNPNKKWLDVSTTGINIKNYIYGTQTPYNLMGFGSGYFYVNGVDNKGENAATPRTYSMLYCSAGDFSFDYRAPGAYNSAPFFKGDKTNGIEVRKATDNGSWARYFEVTPNYLRYQYVSQPNNYEIEVFNLNKESLTIKGVENENSHYPRLELSRSGFNIYGYDGVHSNSYYNRMTIDNNNFNVYGYQNGYFHDKIIADNNSFRFNIYANGYNGQALFLNQTQFAVNAFGEYGPQNMLQVTPSELSTYVRYGLKSFQVNEGNVQAFANGNTYFQINPNNLQVKDSEDNTYFQANPGNLQAYRYDYDSNYTHSFFQVNSGYFRFGYLPYGSTNSNAIFEGNNDGITVRATQNDNWQDYFKVTTNGGIQYSHFENGSTWQIFDFNKDRFEIQGWRDGYGSGTRMLIDDYGFQFNTYHDGYGQVESLSFRGGELHSNGFYNNYVYARLHIGENYAYIGGYAYQNNEGIQYNFFSRDYTYFSAWDEGSNEMKQMLTIFGTSWYNQSGIRSEVPFIFNMSETHDNGVYDNYGSLFVDGTDVKIKVNIGGVMYGATLAALTQI
jgi:hypothetical protein